LNASTNRRIEATVMIATADRPISVRRTSAHRELHIVPASVVIVIASVLLSLSMALAISAAARQPGSDLTMPAPGPIPQPSVAPVGFDR
jgi:hypothetical protein